MLRAPPTATSSWTLSRFGRFLHELSHQTQASAVVASSIDEALSILATDSVNIMLSRTSCSFQLSLFSFITSKAGNYLACFWIDGEDRGLMMRLNLDWKIRIAAKEWDSIAKKEKIELHPGALYLLGVVYLLADKFLVDRQANKLEQHCMLW